MKPVHANERVFLCPGMDGIAQGAREGGALMYRMYGMPQKKPGKAVCQCLEKQVM